MECYGGTTASHAILTACGVVLFVLFLLSCLFSGDRFELPPLTSLCVSFIVVLLAFTARKQERNQVLLEMSKRQARDDNTRDDTLKKIDTKHASAGISRRGADVTKRRYERHAPLEEENDTISLKMIMHRNILAAVDIGYDGDDSNVNSPEKHNAFQYDSQ